MLVMEGHREGRLSRGQATDMLGLGFHEAEIFLKRYGAVVADTTSLERAPIHDYQIIGFHCVLAAAIIRKSSC